MTLPIVVADTSVLINFLKIDRMDLVDRYPGRLLATDHVESELADDYPEQKARYEAAVTAGVLDTCSVTDPAEVGLFLRLGPGVRLGAGECSAIAVALSRGYGVAIDDNRAISVALRAAAGQACAWAPGNARQSPSPCFAATGSPSTTTGRSVSRSERRRSSGPD